MLGDVIVKNTHEDMDTHSPLFESNLKKNHNFEI